MAILKRVNKQTGKTSGYQVLVDTYDANGKRKRHVVGSFRTRKEAKKQEHDAMQKRDTGSFVMPSDLTVSDLMASWLRSKAGEVSPNSIHDYRTIVDKHITPALGTIPVQKLTAARLQAQYDAWRDAGMSPRLIRGCHMRLSQALKQAVRFGAIYVNPCDSVHPPKLNRFKADVWNQQEASAFLHTATHRPIITRVGDTGKTRPDELHPLWHLLLLEGMRRGEALGLRWRDVDFDNGTAHIQQTVAPDKSNRGRAIIQERTKTNAGARSVRLTKMTLDMLRGHRDRQAFLRKAAGDAWQDHDLIVCTSKGTPINPNNVSRSFAALVSVSRLSDGTKLRKIRLHGLRHTCATLLLLAGVPAKVVSERLGHASISITLDLYSHVLPDMQEDAASAMDRFFSPMSTA